MSVIAENLPVVSRRNPASQVKDRAAIGAFGVVMDDLRRAILTPTQRAVMELILEDSLQRGFWSVCYGKLEDLVFDLPGEPPRVNLSANDLSPVFKHQLAAMHLIRAEWSAGAGWYVLVLPSSGWDVQWHRPASRRALRWMHLDGLRRAAAPFLPSFAPDADLYDALARAVPGASANPDAPDAVQNERRGAGAVRRSDFRNADSPAKARCVPAFGTPSRARAALSSGTKSSISALTLSVEQLKDLIRSGRENDFVQAMQAMIPTHENGDGGKWRAKWRRAELNPFVVAMFEGIVEKIAEGTLHRAVALEAHFYWQDFGGAAAEKKLRNLLITQ
jgi:hypothetical protein